MKNWMFFLALALAFSCERIPQTTEGLYQKGFEALKEEDWGKATNYLEKALEGELSPKEKERTKFALANAYFNDGNFEEAAIQYEEFLELYPASPFAKDALFRLGVSYLNLIKGPEWDQTFTEKAYQIFEEFLKRYPTDGRASKAKEYRKIARKILAEHELYIAGTYDMVHKFTASIRRYERVLREYSDVEPMDRLKYLLGRAYYFTSIQAEEEIGRLRRQLEKEKERLNSDNPEERRVAKSRIELIGKDIESWKRIAEENRKVGEKILSEVAKKYPNSPYGVKARRILLGERILNVEPVINPLKRSIWWKIKETL
ncbi:Beta-barrel assembly machine subunit BamD [Phorcysia thermohydrogeniphila]|uniref:Beta-barrel assembly machine subunit BamD n=1 Tax=Phorcysia thermohydrogeniphila TaxID=936138 RepID=A0A4R1GCY0_9BACT|nr:Beta-barrel assembly machine subunit BamD [Phorcysia thermohydrogeniphila]